MTDRFYNIRRFFILFVGLFILVTSVYAERIVTLAPAITEMVFTLDRGKEIVGNTTYCNYPEAAKKIRRVGGLMDINIEILVSLKPTVIILYPEAYDNIKIMEKKSTLVVIKHTSVNDIFDGIISISKVLGTESQGRETVTSIKKELESIQKKSSARKNKKIKTLIVIGRNPDNLSNMYIIGRKDFLNQLLEVAGGVNAYSGDIDYPSISVESIIAMNPDVIFELSAFNEKIEDEKVYNLWNKYHYITAVKNKKILIVKDSFWVIPGPRIAQIAVEMSNFLK